MSDIVFILGAGASADGGAPIMSNFLQTAKDLLRNGLVRDSDREFRTVHDAIGTLQLAQSKAQLDLRNIESVFTAFEMIDMVRPDFFETHGIEGKPLPALKRMIARTLETSMQFPVCGNEISAPGSYPAFIKLVMELRNEAIPRRSVSIITFNYDVGLDLALHLAECPLRYCIDDAKQRSYANAIDWDAEARDAKARDSASVIVLKLHGSLNWVHVPEDDSGIFAYTFASSEIGWGQVIHFGIDSLRMVSANHDQSGFGHFPISQIACATARAQLRVPDGPLNYVPFLVPPALNKAAYQIAIKPVWQRAALELSEAEYIFVIGYSLPDTDQFFKQLYAIGTIGKRPIRAFHVFDPVVSPVAARFRAILGAAALDSFQAHDTAFRDAIPQIRRMFTFRDS